jgi:DMSO/TMAO reductase YedYZ heme-binding membrane subunit
MMTNKNGEEIVLLKTRIYWVASALTLFTLYAVLRYNVFKGVETAHLPLYIGNKILSISGLFLLAASYAIRKMPWPKQDAQHRGNIARFLGLVGFSFTAMHVLISLMILSPAYFPKFFAGDMMNWKGELSMLMGVISLYFFSYPVITSIPSVKQSLGTKRWQSQQQRGYFGLLLALLHSAVMGASGWLNVQSWPGYLPPITLLAVVIAAIPLILKFTRKM